MSDAGGADQKLSTTEPTTVQETKLAKIPQPHGGALNAGGTPGNRGGRGHPPSELRALAREAFARQFPRLEAIAEGRVVVPLVERCGKCGYEPTDAEEQQRAKAIERATRPGEQVRAMEALARVGMSSHISIDDVKARLISQVQELRGWGNECELPAGQLEILLDRLQLVWR
jgi:hypothetical protein